MKHDFLTSLCLAIASTLRSALHQRRKNAVSLTYVPVAIYYLGLYTAPTRGIADIFFLSRDMRMCAGKPPRATDNKIVVENQGKSLESEEHTLA